MSDVRGDLTDELVDASVWSDTMLEDTGIPVHDTPLVTIGGGLGSFTLVDTLRIAGLSTAQIRVLTDIDYPHQTYSYLARVSQIPDHERLRSDSASVLDNIWGWPSYALREAFAAKRPREFAAPLFQVGTEPVLTDFYTPRAGEVYRSVERESPRIAWDSMLAKGVVRMVRRRYGGGYFSILTPPEGSSTTRRVAFRSSYVHIAVGYPGLRFLPDLQEYRQRHGDYSRVVNAYEPHDHVYEDLIRRPGVVVVRGGGIVSSRILQRLIEDIEHNGARTTILHLFRTYIGAPHGPSIFMRRQGGDGFAYQGFNWPKAAWGGQLKERLENLEGKDRADLLGIMGGTNTPKRKLWQEQLARAQANGSYYAYQGEVDEVVPGLDRKLVTRLHAKDGSMLEVPADYIVDATGLEGTLRDHRLLADLLDHCGAGQNPLGRLDVERTFEVRGTASLPGRMYASGSITLGGYYAGVDSFLGLQYAALAIADDLARHRFCPRIGLGRSVSQWWRWVRNRPPD
ncbi:MAG: hypothetical protein ACRDZ1_14090 [Acidimicrobiia bacterium]